MVAEACPSICCTTLTSAPEAMARLAAVCRSWWGCSPGMPMARAASSKAFLNVVTRSGEPRRIPGNTRSSGPLASDVSAQLGYEEWRQGELTALMGLGSAPHQAMSLHRCDGGDDRGPVPVQVDPVDTKGGHLAEPDTGVGEEQNDETVGLVGPGVVARVLARLTRVAAGLCEVVDPVVDQVAVLVPADSG